MRANQPGRLPTWTDVLRPVLGEAAALVQASTTAPSFDPEFERLAVDPGWVVWLGHPPIPDLGAFRLLPAPPELLWDEPAHAVITAAGVSAEYARRRGATDAEAVSTMLRREGPLAVVVPGEVHESLRALLAELESLLGVPLVSGTHDLGERLRDVLPFAARVRGHAAPVGRPHDPALATQSFEVVERIGGNPLSSFVLHHEGERDGVSVVGEFGDRLGIEIGVRGAGIDLPETAALERFAAAYPAFLDGVISREEGHSLEIGWRDGARPTAELIGEAMRAWLKALDGVELVDVRIGFAPPHGRSAYLTDMRARAAAFKELRAAALAPTPPTALPGTAS